MDRFIDLNLGENEGHSDQGGDRIIASKNMRKVEIGAKPFNQWQGELDRL